MQHSRKQVGLFIVVLLMGDAAHAGQVCATTIVTTPTGTTTERVCVDNGVPQDFGRSGPTGPINGSGGTGGGTSPSGPDMSLLPTDAQTKIALCAINKFGPKDAAGNPKYPLKSTYKIVYNPYFKWDNGSQSRSTVDEVSPGSGWVPRAADSDEPSYAGQKVTTIYAHGFTETPTKSPLQELIITLGHEVAHQNGVDGSAAGESQAEAIGAATLAAYKAAQGAGCK